MWWKIWYESDEVTGSTLEEWTAAPEEGVVAIYELFYIEDGIPWGRISSGSDWYWMMPDGNVDHNCYSGDEVGVWVDIDLPEGAVAKKGKWVSEERLNQVDQEIADILNKRYE